MLEVGCIGWIVCVGRRETGRALRRGKGGRETRADRVSSRLEPDCISLARETSQLSFRLFSFEVDETHFLKKTEGAKRTKT